MIDIKYRYALSVEIITKNGSVFDKVMTFDTEIDANKKAFDFRLSISREEESRFKDQEFFVLDKSMIRKSEIEGCRMEVFKINTM